MTRALAALVLAGASVVAAAPRPVRDADLALGRAVYLRDCSRCHGVDADGAGREAVALQPRPRDFTSARFKFRTTPFGRPPATADVLRTIGHGLPGSGMPSFASLNDVERRAVAAWVLRAAGLLDGDEPSPVDSPPPCPASTPERREIGRRLYVDAGCPTCHGPTGTPDPAATRDLMNADGTHAVPRDLAHDPLRGGDAPVDVWYRLVTGMDGPPMPSYADALAGQDVWALVDYVLSLRGAPPLDADPIDGDPATSSRSCRGCHARR